MRKQILGRLVLAASVGDVGVGRLGAGRVRRRPRSPAVSYADFTDKENKDDATGVKSADSGTGTDVKRFYVGVSHSFDSVWSASFVSDIGDKGAKRYDLFVKKAYVQAKISPAGDLPARLRRHPVDPLRRGPLRLSLRRAGP